MVLFWNRFRNLLAYTAALCLSTLLICFPLVAAAQPRGGAEEHMRRGKALLGQGRWESAIEELSAALRLDPDRADTRANLGMAYYFKGNITVAVAEFQAALRIDPERVGAVHGLGLALYEKGDLDGAIEAFRASSRLNPAAYYNLGNILEQQGDRAGAIEAYKQYLAAKPQVPGAAALGNAVSKSIGLTPAAGTAREHFRRGQELLDKRDASEAVIEFLAAMHLKPSYIEASNGLGMAFRLSGKLDEAIAAYQTAIYLDSKFAVAYRNLAQAFEEKGDFVQAALAYDGYLLLVPGAPDAARVRDKIAQLRRGQ